MSAKTLDSLLSELMLTGPRAPVSAECLPIRTILQLLDQPEKTAPQDAKHLITCLACQRAVVLARRERPALEALWSDKPEGEVQADARVSGTGRERGPTPARHPTISLARLFRWRPTIAGIAALLVITCGLSWWLAEQRTPRTGGARPALFGSMRGEFRIDSAARGEGAAERKYVVTAELKSEAYLTYLYLDHTRKLQLPSDATDTAEQCRPGPQRRFSVTVTNDPPGWEWIAAVASDKTFDPIALQIELAGELKVLPDDAPITEMMDQLERALRARPQFSFRATRFAVPAVEP